MERTVAEQFAKCIDFTSYTDSAGKSRQSAVMLLDGDETKKFELPVTKNFKPNKDDEYYPSIDVIDTAQISERTGKAYIRRKVIVRWIAEEK